MKNITVLLITIICSFSALSQETNFHEGTSILYKRAVELYKKEKYTAAQQMFKQVNDAITSKTEMKTNSQFFMALCAAKMFNADTEFLTFQFINDNPSSHLVKDAYFNLGAYFYTKKNWNKALETYFKINRAELSTDQQAEFFFKTGYCYFMKKDFDKAKIQFYEIKDKDTKFTAPATYYYSHIHYQEENYETALQGFLKLTDDKTFGPIVPYYVVQIYYMQGKYEDLTAFSPGIINTVTPKRLAEVSRITAESFFRLENYDDAIKYFQIYDTVAASPAPAAHYQLAYSLYRSDRVSEAIPYFEKISLEQSALGQNASYYLASSYIKLNDKTNAQKAFASAMRSDYDEAIKQDALFNYALVTYELGGAYNNAIQAFEEFLSNYPSSKRVPEAQRYLVQSYLTSKNYKQALASIDKIQNKNDELKEAYQRIAFNRGVELFNAANFSEATVMFAAALKYSGFDKQREARANYWLAESYYNQEKYNEAIANYKKFKNAPIAHTVKEFEVVDYNLAYSYFKLNNYSNAASAFRSFTTSLNQDKYATYKADALVRLADCYFMQTDYVQAVDFYQRAVDIDSREADYALYQKGMCQGLAKNELQKIATLKQLTLNYSSSVYADNGWYEIAQEYLKLQDERQAIEALRSMYNKYPDSELAAVALVQLGLLYYNTDNYQPAIEYYKLVVTKYPGSQESRDALKGLKNIYIDMGKVNDYTDFVEGLGSDAPRMSVSEKDSLIYLAAEKLYMQGERGRSKQAFAEYINDYPSGAYLLSAHFYKGDCHYQDKEYNEALSMFAYVLAKPKNVYTEQSLLGCARIATSLKNYEKSLEYYSQLLSISSTTGNTREAKTAIMFANFELKKYSEAIKSVDEVLKLAGLTVEQKRRATYIKARSQQETGRDMLALETYKTIAGEVLSAEGAEAKYRLAEILYSKSKIDEAETHILEFSGKSTAHVYWLARCFILWADIFADRDNYFQAIETLQSVIDYHEYTEDGIIEMAKQKKTELEAERDNNAPSELNDPVEINIESN